MDVFSGALYQCDFGTVYLKPTRLLTNVPLARNLLVVGPPQTDEQGNYLGPLQKRNWQGPEMIGKASSGSFGTQGSEAWPRELCQAIANSACAELAIDLDAKSPKAGEVAAVRDACPSVPAASPPAASWGPREVEATTKVKSKDYARTHRRKASSVEIARIRQELPLGEEKVYIGRITGSKGSSSVWANPFKIGVHGSRAGVLALYRQHLNDSGLATRVSELSGKLLLCHCADHEDCHGDILEWPPHRSGARSSRRILTTSRATAKRQRSCQSFLRMGCQCVWET